jgi:single-stranded DNA-specific DHH superfamily exonuclease
MERIGRWIREAESVCLVTHTDTDGICSGAIFLKALKKITKKEADLVLASANILANRSFYERLPTSELYVFTDLPLDQSWEVASQKIGNKKIMIMDHHIPKKNLNSSRIVHINPMFDRDVYYPASKIVFDVFSEIVDIKELDWLAVVGIIGDMGVPDTKTFVRRVMKKYGVEPKNKDPRESAFGRIDELIGSAMVCRGEEGAMEAIRIVERSEDYKGLLNNAKLGAYREKVEKNLEELKKEFEKKAEYYKEIDTLIFEMTPKYNIGSVLATVLSKKIENKTIIIINRRGNIANLNFRRQDGKVDMKELAEFATKGFGKGGGHKKAAGGTIGIDKVEEFKIRAVSWLMLREKPK